MNQKERHSMMTDDLHLMLADVVDKVCHSLVPYSSSLRYEALIGVTVNNMSCIVYPVHTKVGTEDGNVICGNRKPTAECITLKDKLEEALLEKCQELLQDTFTVHLQGTLCINSDNLEVILIQFEKVFNQFIKTEDILETDDSFEYSNYDHNERYKETKSPLNSSTSYEYVKQEECSQEGDEPNDVVEKEAPMSHPGESDKHEEMDSQESNFKSEHQVQDNHNEVIRNWQDTLHSTGLMKFAQPDKFGGKFDNSDPPATVTMAMSSSGEDLSRLPVSNSSLDPPEVHNTFMNSTAQSSNTVIDIQDYESAAKDYFATNTVIDLSKKKKVPTATLR